MRAVSVPPLSLRELDKRNQIVVTFYRCNIILYYVIEYWYVVSNKFLINLKGVILGYIWSIYGQFACQQRNPAIELLFIPFAVIEREWNGSCVLQ